MELLQPFAEDRISADPSTVLITKTRMLETLYSRETKVPK